MGMIPSWRAGAEARRSAGDALARGRHERGRVAARRLVARSRGRQAGAGRAAGRARPPDRRSRGRGVRRAAVRGRRRASGSRLRRAARPERRRRRDRPPRCRRRGPGQSHRRDVGPRARRARARERRGGGRGRRLQAPPRRALISSDTHRLVIRIPARTREEPAMDESRKWWTLGAVAIGIFMLLLDITVVNVALPKIQQDLDASFSDLQWVVDAYALTLTALLLVSGSFADLIGRRRVFIIGLILFSIASAACGLSQSPLWLIVARGVQGIGGAMLFATSLALIAQAFRGPDRGTAFGIYGATIGAAVAIGPLVGGALTDTLGWEWIFFVNVPIGIAGVFVSLAKIDESSDPHPAGIDWPGAITFSGALFMLVFALIRGNEEGWGSTLIIALFVGAAMALLAF